MSGITLNIKDLNEEIFELQEFMPLDFENDFFIRMFQNMLVVENTDFYNNPCLNLVFFYIYVFHCLLSRLYSSDEKNIEFLKYLQVTENALSKRDGSNAEELVKFIKKDEINFYLFNGKEKDAINYFFHILGFDNGCSHCSKNQEVFDLRNKIAHLNLFIATKEDFDKLLSNIIENLGFVAEKIYQITKKIIYEEVKESKTIDEYNYKGVFETLNKTYYLSRNDYKLLIEKKYIKETKTKTPQFYIGKYIQEELGLELT